MNVSAFVDKLKMQEVMLNLLSNAVKFTPEQGTVMFLFEILEEPIQGCNTRIVVQDTGIGVGHEFISKMFEPFMQEHNALTKNISGGTGLGLSIVKRIVDHMKGFIEVESEQGLGTKFTVLLPIEYRESDVQDNEIRIEDVEFEGQRLLLCEDNMLNMEIAKTLLEDKGFIVDCAEDGVEGLQKYKEAGPDAYAGILMDIRMPRMNGYEAVECIRALDREDAKKVPIIAMTADAYPEDIQHCHDAGMNAHIAKPIDPEDMFRVLAKWCAK
jgi:CheY-like chemotaxis protein/anti-sigma regulatory factor (Ser/Thr protein kinase)